MNELTVRNREVSRRNRSLSEKVEEYGGALDDTSVVMVNCSSNGGLRRFVSRALWRGW